MKKIVKSEAVKSEIRGKNFDDEVEVRLFKEKTSKNLKDNALLCDE